MVIYVNNAFSLKMLPSLGDAMNIEEIKEISESQFKNAIQIADKVVIGHPDTAQLFGVEMNRQTIHLNKGDILYIAELNNETGSRLPSGIEFIAQIGNGYYFRFIRMVI